MPLFCVLAGGLLHVSAPLACAQKPFGGVGLQVVPVDGGEIVVLNVVPDSSAAAAGIRPGDLIVAVDGFALKGSDFSQIVSKHLWGEVGSSVQLRYLRPGVAGERTATCRRLPLTGDMSPPEGVKLLTPGR
jgi:C-terminal processing protease CtpA/Prc